MTFFRPRVLAAMVAWFGLLLMAGCISAPSLLFDQAATVFCPVPL
jgi:hypothetical protein